MSNEMNEATVGSNVIVKVGCREIEATVMEITEGGCRVKSIGSGKEFTPKRIIRVIPPMAEPPMPEDASVEVEQATEAESETPNLVPESATPAKPAKKMSLMDAAVEILKRSGEPMNTRELVKGATESGLWTPTDCKTPEQTLYGSFFREMATKEHPRIRKSEQKGKFELIRKAD